jgi:hypothetical protein
MNTVFLRENESCAALINILVRARLHGPNDMPARAFLDQVRDGFRQSPAAYQLVQKLAALNPDDECNAVRVAAAE